MCRDCGATVNNGWFIKCEQDGSYQRVFKIDLMKRHDYHTQKSSAGNEDQLKIEEQVVRSIRLKKLGEYLPKKSQVRKRNQ